MGKLAQRFRDPAKSGVYRVTDATVPGKAAREAGLALLEVPLEGVQEGLAERTDPQHPGSVSVYYIYCSYHWNHSGV